MKTFKNLTVVSAFLLSLLLQTATAQAGGQPQIEVTFAKWVTTFPHMEGDVGGDIVNPNAFFRGEILSLTPVAVGGQISRIEARYEIIAGDQSFTAIVHGIFDWRRGKGVMNGVITKDWHEGSQVHVQFDAAVPSPEHGIIIVGTITILPN